MSKTCNNCADKTPTNVPYVVHESAMARAERSAKRLWAIIIVQIIVIVGLCVGFFIYESQFEDVITTEEYQIEQDTDNGHNNSIINGGEIANG